MSFSLNVGKHLDPEADFMARGSSDSSISISSARRKF
jgi:hypothetical protein